MSKLSRMKLSGIRSFGSGVDDEQDIRFACPVTLFLGQNGCGKTTIIEALKFAITGDLPAGTKSGQGFIYDPQMAKKTESRGQIKLKVYDSRGQTLTITKIARVKQMRDKLQYQLIDSTISREGEPISNRCADVHRETCSSMGVPKAIFNYVIFCHQEDSHWPLEEPKKLKERFDAIFDSAKYNKCIESIIKLRKKKMEKIKTLAIEVEHKSSNKKQMEKKRYQLREKEERLTTLQEELSNMSTTLVPVQSALDKVYALEKNINQLHLSKKRVVDLLEINSEQQKEIMVHITEETCTDEELDMKIGEFENELVLKEREISKNDTAISELEQQENNIRKEINLDQIKLGKLCELKKENENKVETKNKLISQSREEFKINVSVDSEPNSIIKTFKKQLNKAEISLREFESNAEKEEKVFQDKIDEYRTKYVQLEQSIDTKKKQLSEMKSEKLKVVRKLTELHGCDSQLQNIESRLARTENDITEVESQVNVHELRTEIQSEKLKYNNLEDQLQKVENEIQIMQTYCSIQTELDLQNDNLLKKQNDVKKLKLKHETNFENIFNDEIPEANLKPALELYLRKVSRVLIDVNSKITEKQKNVATLEANLHMQKEKLSIMKKDLDKDKQLIEKYFKDETYEEIEFDLKRLIENLQNKKGICTSSIKMYSTFISSFKETKPCCPVCMRDVKEKDQVTKIIEEIQRKIQAFPEDEKEAERKLAEAQKRYSKICELKPTYFKNKQIQGTDLPELIKKVSSLESEVQQITNELNLLQTAVKTPQKNQELANKVMSDFALIDQYTIEVKKIQNEISSLSSRMPTSETNRSMQEALNDQENLKSSSKSARLNIESLNNKLTKHAERLQYLKELRNKLKTDELEIKQDLQGLDQLEIKNNELETKLKATSKEIYNTEKELGPTKSQLDDTMAEKEKTKLNDKKTRGKMALQIEKLKKRTEEIISLHDDVTNFSKLNIDEEISEKNQIIENKNKQMEDFSETKKRLVKKRDELKDMVINSKTYHRSLLDNKKLREKKLQAKKLTDELKEFEAKIGSEDIRSVQREIRKLEEQASNTEREINRLNGQKTELKKSIKEARDELSEPIYANAVTQYKKKYLEHKTLEKSIVDLSSYAKALDWAMLQYHKQQMVYINQTIRELWRAIYKGNDIDYIEIKTDTENSSRSSSDKRRDYQYRLVQVKNDVELEMRGRCSAGQKVLASLVIRIALADTFSVKCGILALDEPTTNLDKENIGSLCEALCELVTRKKQQKNFQLLIITHDQDFLEKLSRAVLIEDYYLVFRNSEGKSNVQRINSSF